MVKGALEGLRAVITGGSSGIGLATAVAFRDAGSHVGVLDLADPPTELTLKACRADVGDDRSVRDGMRSLAGELGGVDIVVSNAGIGAQGTVEENSDDEWHRVLDINVLGTVRVVRAALPYLRTSEHASVVVTCSIAATAGLPRRALYSASKGALLSLTRAMAADHLHEGIRFNCVNPGTADTPWVQRLMAATSDPAGELAALSARQPHGRLVSAEEVAAAVVYLASPAAGSTTGTDLAVDGGMSGLRLPGRTRAPDVSEP
jgi:2-keto-3-deoxy-L-fuconate dehydrogenase